MSDELECVKDIIASKFSDTLESRESINIIDYETGLAREVCQLTDKEILDSLYHFIIEVPRKAGTTFITHWKPMEIVYVALEAVSRELIELSIFDALKIETLHDILIVTERKLKDGERKLCQMLGVSSDSLEKS